MFTGSARPRKFRCLAAARCATSLATAGEIGVSPGKLRVIGENEAANPFQLRARGRILTVNQYGAAHYRTKLQTIPTDPTKATVLQVVVAADPKVQGQAIMLERPQKKTITIVFDT